MKLSKPPFDYATFLAQLRIFLPCEHPRAEPRRKRKNGSAQPYYRIQCPECGAPLSQQLGYDLVEDFRTTFGEIKDWDYSKEAEWLERRVRVGSLLVEHQNSRRDIAWWRQYEAYLASPEWRVKREAVLSRCNRVCQVCEKSPATEVHHVTYDRVGEEQDGDLMGVCRTCHEAIHGKG